MSNVIVCGPGAAPLAFVIAWRSEPAPESLVLVTVKVAAAAKARTEEDENEAKRK